MIVATTIPRHSTWDFYWQTCRKSRTGLPSFILNCNSAYLCFGSNLSALFLVGYVIKWAKNASIRPKKSVSFGPNLQVSGPKIHFLEGWSKTFSSLISGNQWGTFFCVDNIDQCGSNWPLRTKVCGSNPKVWIFGTNSQFLFWNCNFCQQGISSLHHGLKLSQSDHPEKIPFSNYGSFFGAHPCLWSFWAWNYGETAVFTFGWEVLFSVLTHLLNIAKGTTDPRVEFILPK